MSINTEIKTDDVYIIAKRQIDSHRFLCCNSMWSSITNPELAKYTLNNAIVALYQTSVPEENMILKQSTVFTEIDITVEEITKETHPEKFV